MVEVQKLKPQLKEFIDQNDLAIDLDDPASIGNNQNLASELNSILAEISNNLNTPELDNFLKIQKKPLTPATFLKFF